MIQPANLNGYSPRIMSDEAKFPKEEINAEIHALRLSIAEATKTAKSISVKIGRNAGGRELSLVITKLQEAKMWGGKVLEENGEPVISDEPAKAECPNGCKDGAVCSDCPKK
jgi:hypothetical protein